MLDLHQADKTDYLLKNNSVMKKLPTTLKAYKITPIFDEKTIPSGLLKNHQTKKDVWGKIIILEGKLLYTIEPTGEELELSPSTFGVVEPEVLHKVCPIENVKFYVEFYQ